jgi:hypothetical protein
MAQQTVLRGQGNEPAIDQLTGMPLTMEELLRRRGMLAYGGNVTLLPVDAANTSPPASEGASSVSSPVPANAAGTSTSNNKVVASNGQVVDASGETGVNPTTSSVAVDEEALKAETGGVDKATLDAMTLPELDAWVKMAGVGAAVAAGGLLATYLAGRRGGTDPLAPIPVGATGDGRTAALGADDIIEGEYTEVDPTKAGPNRLVGAQRALPSPNGPASKPSDGVAEALTGRAQAKQIGVRGDTPKPREQRRLERQQTGARQANASRELPAGTKAPQLDSFGALPEHLQESAMLETEKIIMERARGRKESRTSTQRDIYGHSQRGRRAPAGRSTAPIDPESVLEQVSRRFLDAWRSNPNIKKVRVK